MRGQARRPSELAGHLRHHPCPILTQLPLPAVGPDLPDDDEEAAMAMSSAHGDLRALITNSKGQISFSSLTITGSPNLGLSVIKSTGACTYPGETRNESLRSIAAMAAFASSIAKPWPMHDLGPIEKDRSACGIPASDPTVMSAVGFLWMKSAGLYSLSVSRSTIV
uniref:Uncharacterized protein n=1 Tax=Oryza barthii TaxID=65489 RepID=A0A0D3FIZ9_9ORYZ